MSSTEALPAPHSDPSTEPIFPDHIFYQVASHSAELELWRLMATSRGVRATAEPFLKPFLKDRVITLDPPIVANPMFSPILPTPNRQTKQLLAERHSRFARHMFAYPRSASLLRNLVIEIRADDEERWEIIRPLAPQLERLEIHWVDERWLQYVPGRPKPGKEYAYTFGGHWENSVDLIASVCPPDRQHTVIYAHIVEVIIVATATVISLVDILTLPTPNLRHLSVSCFCGNRGVIFYEEGLPPMGKVEKLTISGYQRMIMTLGRALKPRLPDLRYLIINIDNSRSKPTPLELNDCVFNCALDSRQLRGLALYGAAAHKFAQMNWDPTDGTPSTESNLERLEMLVLEEQTGWWTNPEEHETPYPLLCDQSVPNLPAIKSITYVDRRRDSDGGFLDGTLIRTPSLGPYSDNMLKGLFQLYPTLQLVQWVNDYPPDPFAWDGGSEEFDVEHVFCREHRP